MSRSNQTPTSEWQQGSAFDRAAFLEATGHPQYFDGVDPPTSASARRNQTMVRGAGTVTGVRGTHLQFYIPDQFGIDNPGCPFAPDDPFGVVVLDGIGLLLVSPGYLPSLDRIVDELKPYLPPVDHDGGQSIMSNHTRNGGNHGRHDTE